MHDVESKPRKVRVWTLPLCENRSGLRVSEQIEVSLGLIHLKKAHIPETCEIEKSCVVVKSAFCGKSRF